MSCAACRAPLRPRARFCGKCGAPVGVALGFATPLGAVGIWIGLALGLAAVAILLMTRWLGKERRGFLV